MSLVGGKMAEFSNWVGYVGVALTLYAYYLSLSNKVDHKKYTYSLLNGLGSLCIIFSLFFHLNLPAAIIEGAWIMISFYGIGRVYYYRKYHR